MKNQINMKKYLFIVLLVGVCFGQDIIKYDGKELKGQYVSHDHKTIKFIFEDRKNASEFPFDRKRLEFILLSNGDFVELRTPEEIAKELAITKKFKIAKKCDGNKNIKVSIIPLKNDKWAITKNLEEDLVTACFNVETSYARVFKYFNDKNIKISDINDAHILKAQKDLGIDRLMFGNVEKIDNNYANITAYYLTPASGNRIYMYINYPAVIFYNYINY